MSRQLPSSIYIKLVLEKFSLENLYFVTQNKTLAQNNKDPDFCRNFTYYLRISTTENITLTLILTKLWYFK